MCANGEKTNVFCAYKRKNNSMFEINPKSKPTGKFTRQLVGPKPWVSVIYSKNFFPFKSFEFYLRRQSFKTTH